MSDELELADGVSLRAEAARCRRVAEGLSSKADRTVMLRLAEEREQAAASWERRRYKSADE